MIVATLCLIGWLTLILWPGGQPPAWVVVVIVCVFSIGGPASGIGFMLARDYNPQHRISTATGLVNVGGFCGSVVMVFAVGQILDWLEPGASMHSLGAYRWALVAIAAITAFGIFRMTTWLLRTRVGVLRAAARGEDVPVEIHAHRWDLLDTGEFTIVRKPAHERPDEITIVRKPTTPPSGRHHVTGRADADRPVDTRPAPALPVGGGLLLVDKPSGCTSHDVVGRLRHVLRTRRIGHAGTLDPMATGLLVLAVDRSTKLLGHLALTDKTYLATIRLGQRTDTDDADGLIVDSSSVGCRHRRRHRGRGGRADRPAAAGAQFGLGDQGRRPPRLRPGPRRGNRRVGRSAGHRVPVRDPRRPAAFGRADRPGRRRGVHHRHLRPVAGQRPGRGARGGWAPHPAAPDRRRTVRRADAVDVFGSGCGPGPGYRNRRSPRTSRRPSRMR